jgi:hypothetical protein
MVERAVATEAGFSIARALILLRCIELLFSHVGHVGMLAEIREIFAKIDRLLGTAAQQSCLIAGFME